MSLTFFHGVFVVFFALFAVISVYFQWRVVKPPKQSPSGKYREIIPMEIQR